MHTMEIYNENELCLFALKNLELHYVKAFHNGLSIFAAPVILTMSGFQNLYHSTSNGLCHLMYVLRLQYKFYSTHERHIHYIF